MEWLTANWFWVLIFIAFIAMHLFGHGGHSGHGRHGGRDRQRPSDESARGGAQSSVTSTSSGGHEH